MRPECARIGFQVVSGRFCEESGIQMAKLIECDGGVSTLAKAVFSETGLMAAHQQGDRA